MALRINNIQTITDTLKRGLTKNLDNVTFFVTSQCNLRCKYCFNNAALGKKDDLTLEEIKKIFSHFKTLNGILLSGGEPFMREDLYEIIDFLIKDVGIKSFGIPSNGVDTKRTITKSEYLAKTYPRTNFVVCNSIDPTKEIHNRFRGTGIFDKVIKTAKQMVRLDEKYPNLLFLVNSVVTKETVPYLDTFIDFIYEIRPSLHTIDIVRTYSDEDKKTFANFTKEDYQKILAGKLRLDQLYKGNDLLLRLYNLRTKIITKAQIDCIENTGKWPIPCLSGITRVVIDANGDLRICENKNPLGNLRKYNYNYTKLLESKKAQKELERVAQHKCDCNHSVALRESVETQFLSAAFNFFLKSFKK